MMHVGAISLAQYLELTTFYFSWYILTTFQCGRSAVVGCFALELLQNTDENHSICTWSSGAVLPQQVTYKKLENGKVNRGDHGANYLHCRCFCSVDPLATFSGLDRLYPSSVATASTNRRLTNLSTYSEAAAGCTFSLRARSTKHQTLSVSSGVLAGF